MYCQYTGLSRSVCHILLLYSVFTPGGPRALAILANLARVSLYSVVIKVYYSTKVKSQVDPRVKRVPARQSLRATLACTKPDTS